MTEMTDSTFTPEPKKKGTGGYIAVIIILILALGGMFFWLSSERAKVADCAKNNSELEADMKGMNEMLEGYVGNLSNDLKTDFQLMLKNYDELKKNGTPEQNKEIAEQQEKIQELLDELESGKKMSAYQISKLRKENETLRKIMKDYVYEIDSLNTLNLKLTSKLDSTSSQLTMTKEERDQLEEDNKKKDETIGKAQKLIAGSISSGALRGRLNGTTTETTKARNAVQLVSSFTIMENSVATKGNKDVYMQITDPNGKVFQKRSSNFTSTESGDVMYTDMKAINYTGSRIDVAIYYDLNGQEIDKGNYKVKIYCQGQLIGSDSFSLK